MLFSLSVSTWLYLYIVTVMQIVCICLFNIAVYVYMHVYFKPPIYSEETKDTEWSFEAMSVSERWRIWCIWYRYRWCFLYLFLILYCELFFLLLFMSVLSSFTSANTVRELYKRFLQYVVRVNFHDTVCAYIITTHVESVSS